MKQSTQKVNAFHKSGGVEKLGLHRLSAHTCNECGQNFSNAGALGSHRSKVHRIVAVSTALAQRSVCHVCMKDFHDTKWRQRHLNAVERCRRALQHGDCAGDGPFVLKVLGRSGPHGIRNVMNLRTWSWTA